MKAPGLCWTALPFILAIHAPAFSQEAAPAPPVVEVQAEQVVEFSADTVTYDSNADIVTATGRVRMQRDGNFLAADQVVWTRETDEIRAEGNVVLVTPEGDKLVGERIVLNDALRDGVAENLLVVLEGGGRIAATRASRSGGRTILENAVYSPCPVLTETGCPKNPSWKIVAARVVQDPASKRVHFEGGRFSLFGITVPLLPILSIGTDSNGVTGALIPNFSISSNNGFEVAMPYYWRLAPNRDLTLTPHLYTKNLPAIEGKFRNLSSLGAFQVGAFLTYGKVQDDDLVEVDPESDKKFRLYFEANGKFQLDPFWSVTSSLRAATDKTMTRQYDITRDAELRNFVDVERISPKSYITIAGWAFQGMRVDDQQKRIPIALPAMDARFLLDDRVLGGQVELQANSLAIMRIEGQDTQRAFASARWDLRKLTRMGHEVTFTALARGDVYHSDENDETAVDIYQGKPGWEFRGIGALAADVKWPFIGQAFGGSLLLVPRVQLVLTPRTKNLEIPNEDSRDIDLEDSNLFALNRFAGYDRWEDRSRVTYGVEWTVERPGVTVSTTIGQSYRFAQETEAIPDGTGLTGRLSDIVGRTRFRFGNFIDLTHRFRVDKDSFAPRRNELDLTVGTTETYAMIGYLRLNRNISAAVEDLRDKEEIRVAGRIKFARYWSVFGASVFDLTGKGEDPLSLADGYEPVRQRLGILYEDDCLQLGLSWKRDYERVGEFKKGSTVSLQFALKGIGR